MVVPFNLRPLQTALFSMFVTEVEPFDCSSAEDEGNSSDHLHVVDVSLLDEVSESYVSVIPEDNDNNVRRPVSELRLIFSSSKHAPSSQSVPVGDTTSDVRGVASGTTISGVASGTTRSRDKKNRRGKGAGPREVSGTAGRRVTSKRSILSPPAGAGRKKMTLRKSVDSADKASKDKSERGGGGKPGKPSGGVLLEVARKGLRPTGRSESSPSSFCEGSDDAEQRREESQQGTVSELSVAERRARFLKHRSRSLSSSPVPSESVATSPPRASSLTGAGVSTPTSHGRLSPRPSDVSSVASWGIIARADSISPRPSAPVSPNAYSVFSRSPSPQYMRDEQLLQQRSGGIPRPRGGVAGGAGFGSGPGIVVASPRLRRPQAQRPQMVGWKTGEEKIGDNGCGLGTLSGPKIEAAAFSVLLKGGDSRYDSSSSAVGYDERVEGRLGDGVVASGRVSRVNSLDSVTDSTAAEARAVTLGSDLNYGGDGFVSDDWMQSQPTTPTVPQVIEESRGLY